MTPLERAIAAGHPSAAGLAVVEGGSGLTGRVGSLSPQRGRSPDVRNDRPPSTQSDVVDAPPPRDTMSGDGGSAAAESSSTPWSVCASTASTIESLADRLRRLRAGRP